MPKCIDCENYNGKICKPAKIAPQEPNVNMPDSFCFHIFQPKQQTEQKGNQKPNPKIRQFDSGATRDTDIGKLDYEGFLSPLVLKRYAEYLNKHRIQSDGNLRDSDNWQKGIPVVEYMKSKARHFMSTWLIHRGFSTGDIEESLCAEIFNSMGMLFEILKTKNGMEKEK